MKFWNAVDSIYGTLILKLFMSQVIVVAVVAMDHY
jgi:hypothetical protein